MISFFKFQDPLRFGMIFIILVIIRLPALIYGYPLLLPELTWQLAGEKMNEEFLLYRDILEGIEPFSGGAYFLIHSIFGKSQFAYQVISLILVFIQAILFNFILNINNVFADKTFVPALLYIILSSLFFDFYTLSPVLMGMTFLIFATHFVFMQIKVVDSDENLFYSGLLTAIASLFYFPLLIFIFLAIAAFILFSPTTLRKTLILLMGFLFPFSVVAVYYFVRDGWDEFIYCLFYYAFTEKEFLFPLNLLFFILAIPAVILLLSLISIITNSRYTNYQYVTIRFFGVWLVLCIFVFYFSRVLSTFQLFICVPPLAFFGTHYFLLVKNKYVREISFGIFTVIILFINYGILYGFAFKKNPIRFDKMVAKKADEKFPFKLENKKLLVLGKEKSYYIGNKAATPYLNWDLSQKHFSGLNSMENISEIYSNFSKDLPEVIIDKEKIASSLFEMIPQFKKKYEKVEGFDVYVKK